MNRPRGGGETAGKSGDWAAFSHSGWRSNKCWEQFLGKQISHPVGPGERRCVCWLLLSCQNKTKWLQHVLPASSMSDEVILFYGSECFGKCLLLVPIRRGWLHQPGKLTVNKVIYIGHCGCCFKLAHSTLARDFSLG